MTPLLPPHGTTAKIQAYAGPAGAITVNTSTTTIHVHDGVTLGGFALSKVGHSHASNEVASWLGYTPAALGSDGKLLAAQLPKIAITDTYVVSTQAAMLALTAETGDVAIRSDLPGTFILQGTDPTQLSSWEELPVPASGVSTVNGQAGPAVTLGTGDISETGSNKYYTDARARAAISVTVGSSGVTYNPTTGVLDLTALSATVTNAALGSGTASASTFLRGDRTWAAISAAGTLAVSTIAGDGSSGASIRAATGGSAAANTLTLAGGNSSSGSVGGGHVIIVPGVNVTGGSGIGVVYIQGSPATAYQGATGGNGSGSIHLQTGAAMSNSGTVNALVDRLVIQAGGAWSLQNDTGTAGYVLTTNGPGVPPTWSATSVLASNIGGVIPTANLGTGTASASTILYGDGTWKAAPTVSNATPAGSTGQLQFNNAGALGANSFFTVNAATGTLQATTFQGSGALLTALPASALSGVVPSANLGTGTASSSTILYGDGTWKAAGVATSLAATAATVPNASTLVTGTFAGTYFGGSNNYPGVFFVSAGAAANNRISGLYQETNGTIRFNLQTDAGNNAGGDIFVVSRSGQTPTQFTLNSTSIQMNGAVTIAGAVVGTSFAGTHTGVGTGLTALNATQLTSGTVAVARLGAGTTDATTVLYGDGTWKTAVAGGTVTALSVVTANGVSGSVATSTTTPAITITLGAITPTSVSTGAITMTGVLTSGGSAGTAGYVLTSNGASSAPTWQAATGGGGATLPTQTGNSGKFLTTDGTNTSWASAGSGTFTGGTVSGATTFTAAATFNSTVTVSGQIAVPDSATASAGGAMLLRAGGNSSTGNGGNLTLAAGNASGGGVSGGIVFNTAGANRGLFTQDARLLIGTATDNGYMLSVTSGSSPAAANGTYKLMQITDGNTSGLQKSMIYASGTSGTTQYAATTGGTAAATGDNTHYLYFSSNKSDPTCSAYNPIAIQAYTTTNAGGIWGAREIVRFDPGSALVTDATIGVAIPVPAVLIGRNWNSGFGPLQVTGNTEITGTLSLGYPNAHAQVSSTGFGSLQVNGNVDLAATAGQIVRVRSSAASAVALNLQNSTSSTGSSDGASLQLAADGTSFSVWNYEAGTLRLGTNNAQRLSIQSTGDWSLGTTQTAVGTAGQTIISQGAGLPPVWGAPALAATEVGYGSGSGGLTGYAGFTFTPGSGATRNALIFGDAAGAVSRGVTIMAPTVTAGGTGSGLPDISILAGNGLQNSSNSGNVYITSGSAASTADGAIVMYTSTQGGTVSERLRILGTGGFAFGGSANYGVAGQALLSQGNAAPPVWTTIGTNLVATGAAAVNTSVSAVYAGKDGNGLPIMAIVNSGATTDQKYMQWSNSSAGTVALTYLNDANSSSAGILTFTRSALTCPLTTLNTTALQVNSTTATFTGTLTVPTVTATTHTSTGATTFTAGNGAVTLVSTGTSAVNINTPAGAGNLGAISIVGGASSSANGSSIAITAGQGTTGGGNVVLTTGAGASTAGLFTVNMGANSGGVGAAMAFNGSNGSTIGGGITFTSGTGSAGVGGDITLTTGAGSSTRGNVNVNALSLVSNNNITTPLHTSTGAVTLQSGGVGTAVNITTPAGTSTGAVNISTGASSSTGSGSIALSVGTATTTGGSITATAGTSSSGVGGALTFTAGGGSSNGGAVTVTSGAGSAGTGGNITLTAGTGSTTQGNLLINSLNVSLTAAALNLGALTTFEVGTANAVLTVANNSFQMLQANSANAAQPAVLLINHASNANSGTAFQQFNLNGTAIGQITQNGATGVTYATTSDYRLKNIDGPLTDSGSFIDALKPSVGTWKKDGSKFVGFVAHEFQEVSPQSVNGNKDDVNEDGTAKYQTVDSASPEVMANVVAELQSLRSRNATLEADNALMKQQLASIMAKLGLDQ